MLLYIKHNTRKYLKRVTANKQENENNYKIFEKGFLSELKKNMSNMDETKKENVLVKKIRIKSKERKGDKKYF